MAGAQAEYIEAAKVLSPSKGWHFDKLAVSNDGEYLSGIVTGYHSRYSSNSYALYQSPGKANHPITWFHSLHSRELSYAFAHLSWRVLDTIRWKPVRSL